MIFTLQQVTWHKHPHSMDMAFDTLYHGLSTGVAGLLVLSDVEVLLCHGWRFAKLGILLLGFWTCSA